MDCPFCAEQIQEKAKLCRFCGAVKTGDRWQMSASHAALRPPGTFTMRLAGAAFGISSLLELLSIGRAVPMFGALRGGVVAMVYHAVYVVLFAALFTGLWNAKTWGYRLLFIGTSFYTIDNLRFILDRAGMKAQIDEQLAVFASVRSMFDSEALMQLATITVITAVLCWWGFMWYARLRRSYFVA